MRKNIYETDEVRAFVAAMSPVSRRKYLVARQVLQDVGYLRSPEGEKVADEENLFAVTIHAPDNDRVFYCYDDGSTVFMLHAYAKKTPRIPLREKARALQIRKQLIGRYSMISKEELARGIARTQADMDVALRDPSLRDEVSATEARYAAMALVENYFGSAAGGRRLSAYRKNYHRDFVLTVSLGDGDPAPVHISSREMCMA